MPEPIKILILLPLLAACAAKQQLVPTSSPAETIEVVVQTYVPIPDALLATCPWPREAKLRDVIEVARKRANCLDTYESQLKAISEVSGRPVAKNGD